jgi:hypothetical protein
MSEEREYIKIEIEEEEEEAGAETDVVYQPDPHEPPVTQRAADAGRQIAETARTAWESEQRKQATEALQRGAGTAAERGREAVGRAVSKQTRRKAQSGVAAGIYWVSERLARLAERLMPPPKDPPTQS